MSCTWHLTSNLIYRKLPAPPTTGTTQTCRPSTVVIIFCFNIFFTIYYLCKYSLNSLSLSISFQSIIFVYNLWIFSLHILNTSLQIYFKDTGVDMVVNPYRFPPLPYYAMQYIHIDNINTDLSKNSWSKHQEIVCFK